MEGTNSDRFGFIDDAAATYRHNTIEIVFLSLAGAFCCMCDARVRLHVSMFDKENIRAAKLRYYGIVQPTCFDAPFSIQKQCALTPKRSLEPQPVEYPSAKKDFCRCDPFEVLHSDLRIYSTFVKCQGEADLSVLNLV